MLFAGVQYLMLREGGSSLAGYYPNITDNPGRVEDVDEPFTEFVLAYSDELAEIGRTRYTQTNECRRCTALLPAIWVAGFTRFHLVDFGTSVGLNLQLDRYRYRWGEVTWGSPDSEVELETEMRGARVRPHEIHVSSRTGLDVNPLDPSDPDDRRWLEALVWPEHGDRRTRLTSALRIAATHPVDRVSGDGLATLPRVLEGLVDDDAVIVINSFILNQFSQDDRDRYQDVLADARGRRPVVQVSMEWLDQSADAADIEIDDGSGVQRIGRAQPHGEWLELV
jgi:hypothetical protein